MYEMTSAVIKRVCVQMTGYCTTWSGEGDAAAGTRQAATEIDFHTDIDEDGVELVSPHAAHIWHCQGLMLLSVPRSNKACRTTVATAGTW